MLMVTESNKILFNMLKMKNGFTDIVIKDRLHTRRQTAPKTYDHVAGVYIIKKFLLKSKNIFDGKVKGYFVDNICSFDIDNYSNFEIAEALTKNIKLNEKILLIGGNGVLGSTYVENFINNTNYKIVVLDLDNKNIKHLKGFTFIKTDISKFVSLKKYKTCN